METNIKDYSRVLRMTEHLLHVKSTYKSIQKYKQVLESQVFKKSILIHLLWDLLALSGPSVVSTVLYCFT